MTAAELAIAVIAAVRGGDLDALRRLVDEHSGLASSRLGGAAGSRTPLHVVTDWPGYFPKGPEIAGLLSDAGAVVDVRVDDDAYGETLLVPSHKVGGEVTRQGSLGGPASLTRFDCLGWSWERCSTGAPVGDDSVRSPLDLKVRGARSVPASAVGSLWG